MNYKLWQDSDSIDPIFIADFDVPPEFRPRLNDQFTLPNDLRVWRINRIEPSDNPADQTVNYYASLYVDNSNSQYNIMVQDFPPGYP